MATVADGLYGIILTDVATSSTTNVVSDSGDYDETFIFLNGLVVIFLSDNAVINQVGNTVTITNAGTDSTIEFRSVNGLDSNYLYIRVPPPDTFTVTVIDVYGTANFGTATFGTSFISNATLTLLSVIPDNQY